jgi:hypothetical protein
MVSLFLVLLIVGGVAVAILAIVGVIVYLATRDRGGRNRDADASR